MRAALARLQVAVSTGDDQSIAQAAMHAAMTVELSRLQIAGGYMCTHLYVCSEIPRGWVLTDGTGRGAIHPANLPHVFVGEREHDLVRDLCSAPPGARLLSDHVMARHLGPDLDLLAALGDIAPGS